MQASECLVPGAEEIRERAIAPRILGAGVCDLPDRVLGTRDGLGEEVHLGGVWAIEHHHPDVFGVAAYDLE